MLQDVCNKADFKQRGFHARQRARREVYSVWQAEMSGTKSGGCMDHLVCDVYISEAAALI